MQPEQRNQYPQGLNQPETFSIIERLKTFLLTMVNAGITFGQEWNKIRYEVEEELRDKYIREGKMFPKK